MFSFRDITHDTQTTYRLAADEQTVFFLHNRGGNISFELTGPRAEAHIFALFELAEDTQVDSTIHQVHVAPQTVSSFTGRSILSDQAICHWKGSLSIAKNASQSSGHQEMRHLLLSSDVKASSFPSLEIETDDVRCGHAATMSAPDPEQLFFLRSRGLSNQLPSVSSPKDSATTSSKKSEHSESIFLFPKLLIRKNVCEFPKNEPEHEKTSFFRCPVFLNTE
jgi:hypothetical protein